MIVHLRANDTVDTLARYLNCDHGQMTVTELDLTNCIRLEASKLTSLIAECSCLTSLRCLGCRFEPTEIITLLWRLRHLAEVEFSLMLKRDVESELRRIGDAAAQYGGDSKAYGLRRMYVEVGDDHISFLPALLHHCPYLRNLHVHFSCGNLLNALRQCHDAVLADDVSVETFTFTSEVLAPVQRQPRVPFDLTSCATVCANVRYTKSTGSFSCVRLFDLVEDKIRGRPPRILPVQVILVAVENAQEGITEDSILVANHGHNWVHVRQLCLLLVPPEPACVPHPTAGVTYREILRFFFSTALRHIVELNVSSFHFGPDLDFGDLLQDGSLACLHSLSASLCGLRRPSVLRRLAQSCPEFKDLDVRILEGCRDGVVRCDGCVAEFRHDTAEARDDAWRPLFGNGLRRLNLTDVHDTAWLSWFIESCCPTATVMLCDSPSKPDYATLTQALVNKSVPATLILRHDDLQLDDTSVLDHLRKIVSLQYLNLSSAVCLPEDDVVQSVRALHACLPRLLCLHVHYRESPDASDKRVTWMRAPSHEVHQDVLILNGACFQSCSTATFIGLAKPLYHDVQPML
ncbi:uncharacterized protein LOC119399974 [Rhipicephalus sanguineus]|uniref:Uncharacterized protein n=1 Tax=Rhipicephalus sanguineus TaxID=34632 RepID=A0A9D4PJN3_RHISA|nr:uncharacterized protein LOC119399974 [Rhipicephalus sanguineus]KAH7944416.1 hypothetical protein HPB52_019262 [Rhipicephalus sanguineus]